MSKNIYETPTNKKKFLLTKIKFMLQTILFSDKKTPHLTKNLYLSL